MKAIILAAGRGERMRPLTDRQPKPLLRAGGRSLIEWQIERLAKAGFTQLVVNVSHLGAQIEAALGSGERLGVKIEYSREPSPLETAGGIAQALPLLQCTAFLAVNADVYCEYDYARLHAVVDDLSAARGRYSAHVVLVDNPPHHIQGDFFLGAEGAISASTGVRLTYSGIGVFRAAMFKDVARGERRALGPMLHEAVGLQTLRGEHYPGIWLDIGTPQRLDQLRALLGPNDAP
jgi:MurNAc alpha-1-phosphate uridylyltransferase